MNTIRDLEKRLLNLYPIDKLRTYFNVKGGTADILEEITGNATKKSNIIPFTSDNILTTKQNIYLFTLNRSFNRAQIVDAEFPLKIQKEKVIGSETTFFLLPKVKYKVYLSNPVEMDEIAFYQPVLIRVTGRKLFIHYTKLVKSLPTFFDINRNPKVSESVNDEETSLNNLKRYLDEKFGLAVNDFNQGIKKLWADDKIDCRKLRTRQPSSTRSDVMDINRTFKIAYPGDYPRIITAPLQETTWKCLAADEYFCDGFKANPSKGELSFAKFADDNNQVKNVIAKILEHN